MSKCWLSSRDKLSSPDYMVSHWLLYYAYRVVFFHFALFMDRFLKRAAPSTPVAVLLLPRPLNAPPLPLNLGPRHRFYTNLLKGHWCQLLITIVDTIFDWVN